MEQSAHRPSKPWRLQPGLVFRVAAMFVPAAALGTVGHELGHWLVARLQGCAPELHYAFTSVDCPAELAMADRMWGIAAGPVGTMLSGTLGMVGLARWRRGVDRLDLAGVGWSVLALFWSRAVFNFAVHVGALAGGLAAPERLARGDEARLSLFIGGPVWSVGGACAVVALGACAWTIWRIPSPDRLSWFTGVVVGALLGYALWMAQIGPIMMP